MMMVVSQLIQWRHLNNLCRNGWTYWDCWENKNKTLVDGSPTTRGSTDEECSMSRHRDAETSRSGIRCITFLRIAHVMLFRGNSKWWYWFGSIIEPCFDWCGDLVSAYFNYLEVYESREAGFVVKCPVELPCAPWCHLLSSWLKAWLILGAFCLPIRAFCVVFTHLRWIEGTKPLDVLYCVRLESWELVSHWNITAHLITCVSFGR